MNTIEFDAMKSAMLSYAESLKDFHFSPTNPLFWVFLAVLFFILLRFWRPKKTLSFCLITGLILLATTKIETLIAGMAAGSGTAFDPFLIRVGCIFVVSIVFLCHFFTGDI